jgi:hypothetical protein
MIPVYSGLCLNKIHCIFTSTDVYLVLQLFCLNLTFSKPQQLSTYALTLFNYQTEVNEEKVSVGK